MYDLHNLALDTIALCSASAIIFYLIKMRSKKNTRVTADRSTGTLEDFEGLFLQLVKESEMSFERISKIITDGRHAIKTLIEKERKEEIPFPGLSEKSGCDSTSLYSGEQERLDAAHSDLEPFVAVSRLSDLGLGAQEIADKVRRPKGEVELIIKLKNWRGRAYHNAQELAGASE